MQNSLLEYPQERAEVRNLTAIKVKANANYTCQECGSTELIQSHHKIPGDDKSMIALCAECHSAKHPNVSKALFFTKNHQPYWHNKSAASLARVLGVHSRTIIRRARTLNIPRGILSLEDEILIQRYTYHPPPRLLVKQTDKRDPNIPFDDIADLAYRLKIPWRTVWRWKKKIRPSKARVDKIELAFSVLSSV